MPPAGGSSPESAGRRTRLAARGRLGAVGAADARRDRCGPDRRCGGADRRGGGGGRASTGSSTTPASPCRARSRRCRSRTSTADRGQPDRARRGHPGDAAGDPPARGRIVFITSIGGLMAFPMFGAYHAAKFGLEAVGDVFRQELRPWGIRVSVVEPGSIATPIWERGERSRRRDSPGVLATATPSSTARRSTPTARWRGKPAPAASPRRRSRGRSSTRSAAGGPAPATWSALDARGQALRRLAAVPDRLLDSARSPAPPAF